MTEIELNTRVCVECKKTFRTPGQEQLCPSCREKHKRESLKKEAEDSKKIPIVDAPKKEKPKVSLDEEQRIEKIYNAVHTSRYHGYGEIVSIIESRKGNVCVCCGEEVPEGRMVCPSCESIADTPRRW